MQEITSLSRSDQEQLLARLTHQAYCKMRRLRWRGAYIAQGGGVPGGYEPQDFALRAFEKALAGRHWNRDVYPTLESFLRSIIKSDISHLVESIDNRKGRRLSPPTGSDETVAAYEIPDEDDEPLTVVIDPGWMDRFHNQALKELNGDTFMIELLKCLEAEITKPSEIAILLGITVEEVNNGKKKLRRKLDRIDPRVRLESTRTGS